MCAAESKHIASNQRSIFRFQNQTSLDVGNGILEAKKGWIDLEIETSDTYTAG